MVEDLKLLSWRIVRKLEWILQDQGAAAALISALVTVAGLFVALIPVYVAIRQNRIERQWRRSEVVRSLLTQLTDNPNITLIARVLDWREGPAAIPEPFRPLFDAVTPPAERPKMFFEINWDRFIQALPIDRTGDEWRAPDLFMYRTCFDSFCSFIQSVADDIRTLGAREAEYADLSFYCYRVAFPKNNLKEDDSEAGKVLRKFIEGYYNKKTYDVILRHAELYAITHPEDGLFRASTYYPILFHHRNPLRRAQQRRDNKASISPRDKPRRASEYRPRRFYRGFNSYQKATIAVAVERAHSLRKRWRQRWRRHLRRLRARLRWFTR